MATFRTRKILYNASPLIQSIAKGIQDGFLEEGFDAKTDILSNGAYIISITKGGVFKAVLGMKTALKVTLHSQVNDIYFEASVGIWERQTVPTIISVFVFWPVLITQIWGMIEQSKLDEKALSIALEIICMNNPDTTDSTDSSTFGDSIFCTNCGTKNPKDANFCCGCGRQL